MVKRIWIVLLLALLASVGWIGHRVYRMVTAPVTLAGLDTTATYFFLPTGSSFADMQAQLQQQDILEDTLAFRRVAQLMQFEDPVPGRYRIEQGWSNRRLIQMLRIGDQAPVRLVINLVDSLPEVAGLAAGQLEADSAAIVEAALQPDHLAAVSLDSLTAGLLFIPNTYQFAWNTDASGFVERMEREFRRFWENGRQQKLEAHPLSRAEIGILASIVQKETNHYAEMPTIAGVYMNRLERNMLLQADPTVKFALGDPGIRRVLNRHKSIKSPYNTYQYAGLPPGPITLPDPRALDAVLNYERHNYLFFCAKPDFSGKHVFATNLRQHNINARRYQRALNARGIYR